MREQNPAEGLEKVLKTGKKFLTTAAAGGTIKFLPTRRRAPCKLNNVKETRSTRKGRVPFRVKKDLERSLI